MARSIRYKRRVRSTRRRKSRRPTKRRKSRRPTKKTKRLRGGLFTKKMNCNPEATFIRTGLLCENYTTDKAPIQNCNQLLYSSPPQKHGATEWVGPINFCRNPSRGNKCRTRALNGTGLCLSNDALRQAAKAALLKFSDARDRRQGRSAGPVRSLVTQANLELPTELQDGHFLKKLEISKARGIAGLPPQYYDPDEFADGVPLTQGQKVGHLLADAQFDADLDRKSKFPLAPNKK